MAFEVRFILNPSVFTAATAVSLLSCQQSFQCNAKRHDRCVYIVQQWFAHGAEKQPRPVVVLATRQCFLQISMTSVTQTYRPASPGYTRIGRDLLPGSVRFRSTKIGCDSRSELTSVQTIIIMCLHSNSTSEPSPLPLRVSVSDGGRTMGKLFQW